MKNTVPYKAAKSIWTFCIFHSIPLSMVWQFFLMKKLACHSAIIPYDLKLLLLLMNRFLPGFAIKIPLLLNHQAKSDLSRLNFAKAIENMKLSIKFHNYAMADICAELLFNGRTGIKKNRYEAVEIAYAGDSAGNKRCCCLIKVFPYKLKKEFEMKQFDTKIVVKSIKCISVKIKGIIYKKCHCIYCSTNYANITDVYNQIVCLDLAKSGCALAQYTFGKYIQNSDTTLHCFEKAKYWYLKSALQGYPKAIYEIARNMFYRISFRPVFVTKEEILTAYKLFQYAKYAGNEECDEYLELFKKVLTSKIFCTKSLSIFSIFLNKKLK